MRNQTPQTGFSSWGGGVKGSFSHLYRSILVNVLSQSEKGEVGQRPFIARYVLEPGKKQHCDHRSPDLNLHRSTLLYASAFWGISLWPQVARTRCFHPSGRFGYAAWVRAVPQ